MMSRSYYVIVGRIVGIFGVQGWVKVYSYTRPHSNLLHYHPWFISKSGVFQEYELLAGQPHGKGLVALLAGCIDPTSARHLVGLEVAVPRILFSPLEDGEYYWTDLINLQVVTCHGIALGKVDHLLETGANDVLVVRGERERLIPYLPESVVQEVDLTNGRIVVDWDPEF